MLKQIVFGIAIDIIGIFAFCVLCSLIGNIWRIYEYSLPITMGTIFR